MIDRRSLTLSVLARLADADAFVCLSEAVGVPVKDDGQTVEPYVVLHPSTGSEGPDLDLAETVLGLDWLFQVTCAGGDPEDVAALMSRVDDTIYRWEPSVAGLSCGPCVPPPGYRAMLATDTKEQPHRYWAPLQYQTNVTKETA